MLSLVLLLATIIDVLIGIFREIGDAPGSITTRIPGVRRSKGLSGPRRDNVLQKFVSSMVMGPWIWCVVLSSAVFSSYVSALLIQSQGRDVLEKRKGWVSCRYLGSCTGSGSSWTNLFICVRLTVSGSTAYVFLLFGHEDPLSNN